MNRDIERLAALLDDLNLDRNLDAADADELSELLGVARAVRRLEDVPPPPGGLSRGRAAFVTAGVSRAQGRSAPGPWSWLGAALGRYRLAPVTLAVAALFVGGLVTTAQAQSSLPGDVLYPVKRLTESVQVVMVRGPQRAHLEASLQSRRRAEAQQLLSRQRAETVRFEGLITALAGGRATVDGLVVLLGAASQADLSPGARVLVEGVTGADGVVRALRVRRLDAGGQPLAPPPEPAGATRVARRSEPEPTSTSRPSPTAVRALATATPLPLPTTAPTAEPTASEPPTAVAAAPRVRERQMVEWAGALERVGPEWWVVAGVEFYRPTGRVIGDALVCSRVNVRAERKRGRLELVELVVLSPASKPEVHSIQGTIESIEGRTWVIDGQSVTLTADTEVTGEPRAGRWVRALLQVDACGRRLVLRAEVEGPRVVEFVGLLQSFGDTLWVVDGRSVHVTGSTRLRGSPWVGALVWVRAEEGPDGSLVALELAVRGEPPTATPTLAPTGSPPPPPLEPEPPNTPPAEPTAVMPGAEP